MPCETSSSSRACPQRIDGAQNARGPLDNAVVDVYVVVNADAVAVAVVNSPLAKLGEHRYDAFQKLAATLEILRIDGAQRFQSIQNRGAFESRRASNRVETRSVAVGFAASLCDVQRNRQRRPAELFSQRAVSPGRAFCESRGQGQELDSASVGVESLEAEHGSRSAAAETGCVFSSASASAFTTTTTPARLPWFQRNCPLPH